MGICEPLFIRQPQEGAEMLGDDSEGSKTYWGARESTVHDVQGGSSNGVALWL